MESKKPDFANETLLVDEKGLLLEGLSSNFFVLCPDPLSRHPTNLCLMTAEEEILKGTVRDVVLNLCKKMNPPIPVILQAPNIADALSWKAAFISSTSRLLTPIDYLFSQENPVVQASAMEGCDKHIYEKIISGISLNAPVQPEFFYMKQNPIAFLPDPLAQELKLRLAQEIQCLSEDVL